MSEAAYAETRGGSADVGASGELTAGMLLRNAREAAGLHVAALAVSMKIPVKKLEALEADRLEMLHDAVFVRALAASVCRTLKLDPVPVLRKLPVNTAPSLSAGDRGINAPFRTPGEAAGISVSFLLSKPPALIVLALLLGVAAVVFFPDVKVSNPAVDLPPDAVKSEAYSNQSLVPKTAVDVVETVTAPLAAVPTSAALPDGPGMAKAASQSPAVSDTALVADKSVATVSGPLDTKRAAVAATALTTGMVVFKARGPSWVKVVDAKGVVQLSKTLADGEVVAASGSVPLAVVVGRVDVTDVEVRGKVFDLAGVAKENVARFEVK